MMTATAVLLGTAFGFGLVPVAKSAPKNQSTPQIYQPPAAKPDRRGDPSFSSNAGNPKRPGDNKKGDVPCAIPWCGVPIPGWNSPKVTKR